MGLNDNDKLFTDHRSHLARRAENNRQRIEAFSNGELSGCCFFCKRMMQFDRNNPDHFFSEQWNCGLHLLCLVAERRKNVHVSTDADCVYEEIGLKGHEDDFYVQEAIRKDPFTTVYV